jgi:ApbE superfamily uncharacterized protein (UPF0280 family)
MNPRAQMRMLPDGRRLHLHDGPMDLIVEAFGAAEQIEAAYHAACNRFVHVLDELCGELSLLRRVCTSESEWPEGSVARRMMSAVMPYACQCFITPMAAVAGAVAEEILGTMVKTANLSRAYVNDGGDIALHFGVGERFVIGMLGRPGVPSLFGMTTLTAEDAVRGIATSGWRGRSFSLGIADAVTVLGDRAAAADAAATIIGNAVDLPGHPAIMRIPACELAPDSDLGNIPVTQAVGELSARDVDEALENGVTLATKLLRMSLIRAAALHLHGQTKTVGSMPESKLMEHERGLVHA